MFGSIWLLPSLVLEAEILKLNPISGIFVYQTHLSGFGKFVPGLWYTEEMTNGQSLSGRRGNSVQMI